MYKVINMNDFVQALPSVYVYSLQCLTGKVDNNKSSGNTV